MPIKKSWFKRIRNYIPFVIVIIGLIIYFTSRNKVVALVKTTSIQNRVVKRTVSASGSIKSKNQADMSFSLSGQITYIYVTEGQKVYRGQALVSIDSNALTHTAESYKAALDIARKERDLFIENEDSNKTLYHGQDGYDIKLKELNKAVDQAEANYQVQQANLSKTTIYAPFSGTIINIANKVGETVTATVPVVTVADMSKLYFEISADQSDFGSIHVGQDVEVDLDSYTNLKIAGKVNELPAQANSTDSNFTVKIDITPPADANISIGMTGDAYMTTQTSTTEVPSLVYSEVQTDDSGKPFLWVIDKGKITKFPIEIGIEGDIYTEIKTKVDKQIVIPATDTVKIQEGYTPRIIN